MDKLLINMYLDDGTYVYDIVINDKTYAVHVSVNNEVAITDCEDYSIIYAVFTKKFFKEFYSIPFDYYYLFSWFIVIVII